MLKILLVTRPICPPWDEASKNFAYYLAQSVKGFEIHLLTNGIVPNLPQNIIQENIYTSAKFNFSQKIKFFKFLRKNRKKFDVVQYLFTPTKSNSALIKNFTKPIGAKTIQTIATLREDLYSDEDLKKILFADLVITYSDYSKKKLEKIGFSNIKRIYPGIDLELYSPAAKDPELMEKLQIKSTDFVVTYHGEFTRLGGTDKFIASILQHSSILKQKNIRIILACRVKNEADQKKKKETEKIIQENNLEEYLKIPETFTTLEKLYNLADVATFPVENMQGKFDIPLVVVEAMASEKPVIISDLPIFQEFANEQNSVKIEAGNMNQLFEKILDIFENKQNYFEVGKNARRFVQENFDIKKTAEQYQAVYQEL